MTLEDFFTLTETKNGLTSSARVKEMVNVMLDGDKDCAFKKSFASIIAATEDKDCLDIFINLNGVLYINKWLEDSQKLSNEELIVELLKAVEKLSISYEQSVNYTIRGTVEMLFSHSSVVVQEKAKAVFDSWKKMDEGEAIKGLEGEGEQTMSSEGDIEPKVEVTDEEKHDKTGDDMVPHMCSNDIMPDKVDDIKTKTDNVEKDLHHENMKEKDGLVLKKPFEESLCPEGEHSPCHLEGKPSNSTSIAVVLKEDGIVSDQFSGKEEQMQELASPVEEVGGIEISPSPMEKYSEPGTESNLQTESGINVDNNLKESATYDMRIDLPSSPKDNSAMIVDETPPNHSETMEASQSLDKDYATSIDRSPKLESPDTSSSKGDGDSITSDHSTSESADVTNNTDFSKTKGKENLVANKNMSDYDLTYGLFDALEVARQVAIEVEREVEGRRETSCSSSSQKNDQNDLNVRHSETEATQPNSPASVHGKEMQTDKSDQNDPNFDSSQVPDGVQMTESKPDKGVVDFDLNEDIFSEDSDHQLDTTSTHVSIVSASRAAAAPGLPVSPLQFEGAHGWKGSAATSAFRPASPRRIDTIDNNSNRNQNFLDFDLNMSEDGDEKPADFDLNRISDERDERDAPLSRLSERLLLRNSHQYASPSSSSSSMRNFDLNDQPSLFSDSSELNFFANSSSSQNVGLRSNRNTISIMGAKVEIGRKHTFAQPPFLQNGRIFEPTLEITRGGALGISSAVPYPHPGMFTYNGLTTGPTGNFSPVMYGPGGSIPYMVDLRGAPVVPQLMGSQPPFTSIYGMHPPGFNGPGPSRPNFDLNLGLTGERVNRESGVLRQFLGPGQNFQPSSSAGIGKRKEPDGGWEPYPFDYKHHQWK